MGLTCSYSQATHLVGGELYYECLGNDEYRITLKVYRDCGPNNTNGTGFDPQAPIAVYDNSGTLINTLYIPFPGATQLPAVVNNPCLQVPPNICIEEANYTTTVTLPPQPGGYDLVYQRCCRNPAIMNIVDPQDYGNTYIAHIPDPTLAGCNSSPYYNNYPPLVLCSNEPFVFDHSATDPDGDSLVYEMCTPYHGGTPQNPAPNPPNAPPFQNVIWANGYSNALQINSNPIIDVDPQTGMMTGTPTMNGIFVVGVCTKEYQNGQLINETLRDFQFYVTTCTPLTVASIPDQTSLCDGLEVDFFSSGSINSSFVKWDFGDGDTSTLENPSHTYDQPGTYDITLIVNPGWPCSDTAVTTYVVGDSVSFDFQPPDPQCVLTNNFDFEINGNYDSTAAFLWEFGNNANQPTSAVEDPTQIIFSDSGQYPVSITVNYAGCIDSIVDTVVVFPEPVFDFWYPPDFGCLPYNIQFSDSSLAWTNLEYLWDFGDGNTSTDANPVHTYTNIGVYDVSVTISTDSGCVSTQTLQGPNSIVVNPSPDAQFSITPLETDVYDPNFTYYDQSNSAIEVFYVFPSGDTLFPDNGAFTMDDTGYIDVQQVVINEYGCLDYYTQTVYVQPISSVFVPNAFTPNYDGMNDEFNPVVRDLKDYEFFVFSRWGEVIFQSDQMGEGWDGTLNGEKAPIGVYPYKVVYTGQDNIVRSKVGHVTLVR